MGRTDLLAIVGATATGKTRLGVQLARQLDGEIISADSRQVYRGLDLGSGKDLSEYGDVPYHLIDIVDPGHEFNLFEYQRAFYQVHGDIAGRGKLPILVGGTGLYLEAVLSGYHLVEAPANAVLRAELATLDDQALRERLRALKPELHNRTDLSDRERTVRAIEIAVAQKAPSVPPAPLDCLILGLRWDRAVLRERITKRLSERIEAGMIEEVSDLHERGVSWDTLSFYGLEYRFIAQYLRDELTRNDMFQKLNSAIHRFAKRQHTWFRRMERKGMTIHWIDAEGSALAQCLSIITAEFESP